MNLEQIIEEINKDLDDTFDNGELIGWINRCVDDLTPFAKSQKSAVISLVSGQKTYDVPTDFMKMAALIDTVGALYEVPLRDFNSPGYKLFGNQLIIQPTPTENKELDLYYEGTLPHLVELTDEPQIPSQFHDLFILYTVAKRQYQDDEEARQMNAWSDYQSRKSDFISFNRKSQFVPIRDVYGYGC
jgi:hypothetical protein